MVVERIVPKSNSLEDLQEYMATLASVVRDKEPRSAEKLWGRLLKESIDDMPSRMFEYIPCKIKPQAKSSVPQYFGFKDNGHYYTNARELLTWGWTMKKVLKSVDFEHYFVFKCEAPYFLYGQVSTHNQLTTVSHSQRYSKCERGYWKPSEVKMPQHKWDNIVETFRPNELRELMKKFGVVRKEVWDRGADMLQNRVFTIGGYNNNKNAFPHFIKQRIDSHTQLETRDFVGIGMLPLFKDIL